MRDDFYHTVRDRGKRGWYNKEKPVKSFLINKDSDLPTKASMKPRGVDTKYKNYHTGPIVRFLISKCGKDWNEVYSEICEAVKKDSLKKVDVRDVIEDFVEKNAFMEDGEIYFYRGYGNDRYPIYRHHLPVYIHPETGILTRVPKKPTRLKKNVRKDLFMADSYLYKKVNGIWYEYNYKYLDFDTIKKGVETSLDKKFYVKDFELGYVDIGLVLGYNMNRRQTHFKNNDSLISCFPLYEAYGKHNLLTTGKRQLNSKELSKMGLKNG